MRKLVEATFVSLDGVIEAPERWAMPFFGGAKDHFLAELNHFDALLLGRATYEKFAVTWSQIKGDPYFDKINSMPKFVASKTLKDTTWNATLLPGDAAEAVRRLKAQLGKDIVKYGTGSFDRTLIEHGLIDEFHLSIFPITVGTGRRLFQDVGPNIPKLKLTDTKALESGVVVLTYVPDSRS
jgi:dihydrofolate reductase